MFVRDTPNDTPLPQRKTLREAADLVKREFGIPCHPNQLRAAVANGTLPAIITPTRRVYVLEDDVLALYRPAVQS